MSDSVCAPEFRSVLKELFYLMQRQSAFGAPANHLIAKGGGDGVEEEVKETEIWILAP